MSHILIPDVRPRRNAGSATCPVSEEQAHELLDDELAPDGAAAVREHLERCAECQARVDRLERFLAAIRRQRDRAPAAPDALRARLHALGQADGDA